jgi:hypothetical protein
VQFAKVNVGNPFKSSAQFGRWAAKTNPLASQLRLFLSPFIGAGALYRISFEKDWP